jgi:NADH-quinone oxidoreductase subunit M
MLPLVALLHLLVVLTTPKAEGSAGHFAGALASLGVQLATFGCQAPWPLIALLLAGTLPPWMGLVARERPWRLFGLHMALFALLLVGGWWLYVEGQPLVGAALVLCAAVVRCGLFPAHTWVPGLFDEGEFGTALLFVAPLTGAYAIVRLVLPLPQEQVPGWLLEGVVVLALGTALYAAGLAAVQREARRLFAYLLVGHAALVLVGLQLLKAVSLTGGLSLWVAVALSLTGLGLVLRAVEARFGRLKLAGYLGLYEQSPALAGCFLLMGLASVGFPGTLGFVCAELVVDGAISTHPLVGLVVVLAGAVNGIAVMRAYFLLFTGGRHETGVPLGITLREQVAVVALTLLVLGGGLYPQPGILSRQQAARGLLDARGVKEAPAEGPH